MNDPVQVSTEKRNNCIENKCTADKAIDNKLDTASVTLRKLNFNWWMATLVKTIKIETIMVFLSRYPFDSGFFNQFKVTIKLNMNDDWAVCKGPYSVKLPIWPHVIRCEAPVTLTKYIRISAAGRKPLYLNEVKVSGVSQGK